MIPRLKAALGIEEVFAALQFHKQDDVQQFEKDFADLAQQRYAVAFPYGRTALIGVLNALSINNSEIICPAYTCVVVPHAIVTSGNQPVFLDASESDFNMNLSKIEDAISNDTKAIIVTSIFGHPVNLDVLDEIRNRHPDLAIVQDCAHSFFCEWNGRPVHKAGLCAIYGLNISKIMTSIYGGMVTTDDKEFAAKLVQARDALLKPFNYMKTITRFLYLLSVYPAFTRLGYGFVNRLERSGFLDKFTKYHDPAIIDMPDDYLVALSGLEARIGSVQCKKYPAIINHRKEIAAIYNDRLKNVPGIILPAWSEGATWSHYVIRSPYADRLIVETRKRGVQLGRLLDYHIPSLPSHQGRRSVGGNFAALFPSQVINLPVHMGISKTEAEKLTSFLIEFLQKLIQEH